MWVEIIIIFNLFQLSQGNVPGIESASLAMDTEEGVEVVWNEVQFSDKKVFKAHEVRPDKQSVFSFFSLNITLKEELFFTSSVCFQPEFPTLCLSHRSKSH